MGYHGMITSNFFLFPISLIIVRGLHHAIWHSVLGRLSIWKYMELPSDILLMFGEVLQAFTTGRSSGRAEAIVAGRAQGQPILVNQQHGYI